MKDRISVIKTLLGLALLITFLIIALQVRPSTTLSTGNAEAFLSANSITQSYPLPEKDNVSTNTVTDATAYPEPVEPNTLVQTSDVCAKAGAWVEYVNKEANFSFQYPEEAETHEWIDNNGYTNISLYLQPKCYSEESWGPKKVTVAVLLNTEKLPIEDFVTKRFTHVSTDITVLSQELGKYSKTVSVNEIMALQVNGKITREAPHVYIPYKDLVIFVGLEETTHMPPFVQAPATTLNLFNKILSSVKFLN